MAEPFLSEIRIMSFGFPPKGWALCNGQLMYIQQNQALFALLGTNYGGDGRVNFGLPNLQGRVPFHMGNGHLLGERGGEEAHTVSISELPTHTHVPVGTTAAPSTGNPTGNLWCSNPTSSFDASSNSIVAMNPQCISSVGGSQQHPNMAPFLTLNFCIALQGVFPSQT